MFLIALLLLLSGVANAAVKETPKDLDLEFARATYCRPSACRAVVTDTKGVTCFVQMTRFTVCVSKKQKESLRLSHEAKQLSRR